MKQPDGRSSRPLAARHVLLALAVVAIGGVALGGCSSGGQARSHASVQTCFAYGVRAIERHVTVYLRPPACAGLSQEQVNVAVARAVREVVGPLHKAAARRAAYKDSKYLSRLTRTVRPPPPQSTAAVPVLRSAGTGLRFGALAAWIITVGVGLYLLLGFVGGVRGRSGTRIEFSVRSLRHSPPVLRGHFGVALSGLLVWIAFIASGRGVLAWIAVGMLLPVAGLGMATLLAGGSDDEAGTSPSSGEHPPVLVIAAHGILATLTILLALLAAVATL